MYGSKKDIPDQYKLHLLSETLIKLVKQRPCLWNRTLLEYKDKAVRDAAWTEIYRAVEPEFDSYKNTAKRQIGIQVNKKWCNIRDAYVKAKHYRPNKTGKPYIHTKLLSFLDPFIMGKNESNSEDRENDERIESDEGEENWFNETVYLEEDEPLAKKPKVEIEEREEGMASSPLQLEPDNVLALLTKMMHREEDEDRAFFKSIEPAVKGLSEDSKLEFRLNVLKLIKDLKFRDKTGVQMKITLECD